MLPCARLLLLGALPPHPCPGSVEPRLWPRLFSDALRSVCPSCPGCGKDPDPPRAGRGGSSVYLLWHSALGRQRRTQQSLPCHQVTPAWVKMSGTVQGCPGLRGLFPAALRATRPGGAVLCFEAVLLMSGLSLCLWGCSARHGPFPSPTHFSSPCSVLLSNGGTGPLSG